MSDLVWTVFNVYSLSALAAIIFITVREIATRKLAKEVPTITVVLSTAIGSAVFAGIMMIGGRMAYSKYIIMVAAHRRSVRSFDCYFTECNGDADGRDWFCVSFQIHFYAWRHRPRHFDVWRMA